MNTANTLTKCAFDIGSMFGGQEESDWASTGPDTLPPSTKVQGGAPGTTYVQQKPGKSPLEAAQGGTNPMMQYMLMQQLMGGNKGPSIQLGGGQQDPLQQMLMMQLFSKGMGKGAALDSDVAAVAGGGADDYAKNIMQQLTPEHFQAAGGGGGADTIDELVKNIIPREIVSRHAMQLGGGNVDLGKSILDAHLRQNPMDSGENLEGVLRRVLQSNIASTNDANLQQAMGQLGDMSAFAPKPRASHDDLLKIIQEATAAQAPQAQAQELPPAEPEPGLSPTVGYPKTGRFVDMKSFVKEAIPFLSKAVEFARGGPAVSPENINKNLQVNQFATPGGKPFQFDPDTFHSVLMQDPSVRQMARGLSPEVMGQMGRAMKPGILGALGRGVQKHLMGRGTHIEAAEQALQNLASSTGMEGGERSRGDMAQHFQTMTGIPGGRVGDFLAKNLMGATGPTRGGQASNLFGVPGLGMEVTDPMNQMIQQMAQIRAMTAPQQGQQGVA